MPEVRTESSDDHQELGVPAAACSYVSALSLQQTTEMTQELNEALQEVTAENEELKRSLNQATTKREQIKQSFEQLKIENAKVVLECSRQIC